MRNRESIMNRLGRNSLYLTLVLLLLASIGCSQQAATQVKTYEPQVEMYRPSVIPDRIILNLTADPATSEAVTWRTATSVTKGLAQVVIANPAPKFEMRAQTVEAVTSSITTRLWPENFHSVVFEGLVPDTLYSYRVGDGNIWSEWLQFRTAKDKEAPFSFIYFGDTQDGRTTVMPRVIRQAYKTDPNAGLLVFVGDLVNDGLTDSEWGEFCRAGGWIYGSVPIIASPGNHEYRTDDGAAERALAKHWMAHFTFPENGPGDLAEHTFYVDYQGTRFVVLDPCSNKAEMYREQAEWLDGVLADNPNRWTVLVFHYQMFPTRPDREMKMLQESWKPIIDKHKVDLVLTGHDHVYTRTGLEGATVYVASVACEKMYDMVRKPNMKRAAEDTQMYQIISIDGDTLSFEARTATGGLYDAFELKKTPGKANLLTEKVPKGVSERLRPGKPAE